MRRGFTLLELMIVIIIVGVLATLGIMQYQAAVERARGAEARQVISSLRSICASFYLQQGDTDACDPDALGISSQAGVTAGQIPGTNCWATNYFQYAAAGGAGSDQAVFTATRCVGNQGKQPGGGRAGTLILTTNYAAGTDAWSGDGGY